ncbi:MAG: hypothetical protein NTX81_03980 [Candidatus Bathyarchaeota archaeon]|nr:hypothetical protein [Candidatus Bathyarchaeota archaeon]
MFEGSRPMKLLGAIILAVLTIATIGLGVLDPGGIFEPPMLLCLLNILFLSLMSFVVAYISMRSYLASGLLSVLMIGSGLLQFGSASLIAGFLRDLPGGANATPSVHNIGALAAGLFQIGGSALSLTGHAPNVSWIRLKGALAYLGVSVSTVIITWATLNNTIPTFFVQGTGPTLLRQVVLGVAIVLFAVSSILVYRRYAENGSDILYWYSLALMLTAVGLLAVYLQRAVGSPIGWIGRIAQYFGAVYFLVSVYSASKEMNLRTLEQIEKKVN